jgi:hypothetical protein
MFRAHSQPQPKFFSKSLTPALSKGEGVAAPGFQVPLFWRGI